MSLTVAVCITTHQRRDDLACTLSALAVLSPAPHEILVAADGCRDGTVEFVREHYPQVRLFVHEQAQGSIPSRNELAAACQCDLFVSLDDDSFPLEADFVDRVRTLFIERPCLAVASFAQRSDEYPLSLTAPDLGPSQFIGSYANAAAAIRRSAFEQLGGYPGFFFHAYEEPDFALRCVATGWEVWHEASITIRHHFSGAQRNGMRMHHQHARNELWSVFLRCPAPQLPGVALFRILRQFGYAWKRGIDWVVREPAWWLDVPRGISRCLRDRRPLPWAKYRAWMELVRRPIQSKTEWLENFGRDGPPS